MLACTLFNQQNKEPILLSIITCFLQAKQNEQAKKGALSFCSEKAVVPVINQMERTFPLEIFRKKKEYLLRYYSFLVFTGMIEKSCSICGISIVSSSLVN